MKESKRKTTKDFTFSKNTRFIFLFWWVSSVVFVYVVNNLANVSSIYFIHSFLPVYFPIIHNIENTTPFPQETLWFHFYYCVSSIPFSVLIYRAVEVHNKLSKTNLMIVFTGLFLFSHANIFGTDFSSPGRGIGRIVPLIFNYNTISSSLLFVCTFGSVLVFFSILIKAYIKRQFK